MEIKLYPNDIKSAFTNSLRQRQPLLTEMHLKKILCRATTQSNDWKRTGRPIN